MGETYERESRNRNMRYSEKAFPPLSKEEYDYFRILLNENPDLYGNYSGLYLRQ
jgi:hypothetical protein